MCKPKLTRCLFLAPWLLLCLPGCGPVSNQVPISGTVSYDGQPVAEGTITFMPVSGVGQTTGAQVIDGAYSTSVSPGEQAVQITATKTTTKANPTAEEVDRGLTSETEQYIPAKYNRVSELRVTITSESSEENFDLQP